MSPEVDRPEDSVEPSLLASLAAGDVVEATFQDTDSRWQTTGALSGSGERYNRQVLVLWGGPLGVITVVRTSGGAQGPYLVSLRRVREEFRR